MPTLNVVASTVSHLRFVGAERTKKTAAMKLMVAMRPDSVITIKTDNCQQFDKDIHLLHTHLYVNVSASHWPTGPLADGMVVPNLMKYRLPSRSVVVVRPD